MRRILALTTMCLALSLVAADLADARGGGGMRGGGGSMRGGGGGMRGGGGGGRGGGGFGGGGFGGQRGAATNIQRPSGGFGGGGNNFSRNANFNGNGNFNGNRNINANTNINRNINTNVDRNWNGGGYGYHPVARGAAWGAAAAVTAAAIGSMAYALPTGCSPWGGYYSCGGTWYQPQYSGSDVTYVVVNDPSGANVASNAGYPANPPPPN